MTSCSNSNTCLFWVISIFLSFLCLLCRQVISRESLTSPAEDEAPLCRPVPVRGCWAAVFVPTRPARLAVVHGAEGSANKALTVFDVGVKKTKYKAEMQGGD